MHTPYISRIEKYQADLTIYKKPDSDPTQAITNGALSTLDFLYSNQSRDQRAKNHLTP